MAGSGFEFEYEPMQTESKVSIYLIALARHTSFARYYAKSVGLKTVQIGE